MDETRRKRYLQLKFVRSELGRFGEFSEAVSEWMRRK